MIGTLANCTPSSNWFPPQPKSRYSNMAKACPRSLCSPKATGVGTWIVFVLSMASTPKYIQLHYHSRNSQYAMIFVCSLTAMSISNLFLADLMKYLTPEILSITADVVAPPSPEAPPPEVTTNSTFLLRASDTALDMVLVGDIIARQEFK
jgi:hypothetical protein